MSSPNASEPSSSPPKQSLPDKPPTKSAVDLAKSTHETREKLYKRLTEKEGLFLPELRYCTLEYMEQLLCGKKKRLKRDSVAEYNEQDFAKYTIGEAVSRWYSAVKDYVPKRAYVVSREYFFTVVSTVLLNKHCKESKALSGKRDQPEEEPDVCVIEEERPRVVPQSSQPKPSDKAMQGWFIRQYVVGMLAIKKSEDLSELEKKMRAAVMQEDADMSAEMLSRKWGLRAHVHFDSSSPGPEKKI